jgi:hypothetical protein
VVILLAIALTMGCSSSTGATTTAPPPLHYAANGNFTAAGRYAPGRLGFTMADVSTRKQLRELPRGVKALVYLGLCNGADSQFVTRARPFTLRPRVFGFYLIDEPYPSTCPPSTLKEESDWLHLHAPGKQVFLLIQPLSSSRHPSYKGGYTHRNSGVDLFGVDPYPCRSELDGCRWRMIDAFVQAAEESGIPRSRMIPVFQAFGGGDWVDDGGGHYLMPRPRQARTLLRRWATLLPHPVFDFAYSWGQQQNDRSLETASRAVKRVYAAHNQD